MHNKENNLGISPADQEQRVFSDFRISPGEQKDFKQEAVLRRQEELSGVAEKEKQRDLDDFATYAELAVAELNAHRQEVIHKIYGYQVSETDLRKVASNILDNFDAFADKFGLSDEDKDTVFEQILLLQQGTPEQQEQALRALHARDPDLAEAVVKEAHEMRTYEAGISNSQNADLSAIYNEQIVDGSDNAPDLYRNFGIN